MSPAENKTPEMSGEEAYVSKLTIKTLGCVPAMVKTLPPAETKLAICRIFGKATKTGIQVSKDLKGDVTNFKYVQGNFEGINLQDGTVLRSAKLYLPAGIQEIVEKAIEDAHVEDERAQISFAFEIRSVKSSNAAGYSYEAAALKDPKAEDELAEMRQFIAKLPTHEQKLALKQGGKDAKVLEGQTRKSA